MRHHVELLRHFRHATNNLKCIEGATTAIMHINFPQFEGFCDRIASSEPENNPQTMAVLLTAEVVVSIAEIAEVFQIARQLLQSEIRSCKVLTCFL